MVTPGSREETVANVNNVEKPRSIDGSGTNEGTFSGSRVVDTQFTPVNNSFALLETLEVNKETINEKERLDKAQLEGDQ